MIYAHCEQAPRSLISCPQAETRGGGVGLTFRLEENLLLTPQIATESTLVIGQLDPLSTMDF
jgi:hypothetical protein